MISGYAAVCVQIVHYVYNVRSNMSGFRLDRWLL